MARRSPRTPRDRRQMTRPGAPEPTPRPSDSLDGGRGPGGRHRPSYHRLATQGGRDREGRRPPRRVRTGQNSGSNQQAERPPRGDRLEEEEMERGREPRKVGENAVEIAAGHEPQRQSENRASGRED